MRYRRRQGKNRRNKAYSKRLIACLILIVSVLFYIDHTMNEVMDRAITINKTNLGTALLNNAIETALTQSEVELNRLIEITYKEDQTVATIQTNATEVNRLRTVLTNELLTTLGNMEPQTISIPAGSLTNSPLMQGRGPGVQFKFQPGGTMTSAIRSEFQEAGINQTKHQILLDVAVEMSCIGLLRQAKTMVQTEYLIAETIIVGEIPESYSKILFEDKNRIGLFADQ